MKKMKPTTSSPQVIKHNGMWAVAAPDGTIIKDGLTNEQAWRWLDRGEERVADELDWRVDRGL
jgi:hypothetical protein